MSEFLTFTEELLPQIADFLMTDPIIWFLGLFGLVMVVGVFKKLIYR